MKAEAAFHRITADGIAMERWTLPGMLVYWGIVGMLGGIWSLAVAVWAYQIYHGLAVAGLLHPVMWGTYIATFVFWIGIAHSGTLMSAILFIFRAHWRASIARIAETMTIAAIMTALLFPIIHLGRPWRVYWLIPYPNERGLWINFSSPLIWDAVAIGTYFVVSVLFWWLHLVPDFATLRDHDGGGRLRHRVFGSLALGWTGTAHEWRWFRNTYAVLAGIIAVLVVSVHSVVSWDFAVAIVPGWHSTLFAPYFVAGAMFSGLAMILVLLIPGRELLGFRTRVTDRHLDRVAQLMLTLSLVITYSYGIELFFAFRNAGSFEHRQFMYRLTGSYAPLFWVTIACNSIAPLIFFSGRARRNPNILLGVAVIVMLGMWIERFLIVVSSLAHEYDSYSWGTYRPTYVEWSLVIGSFAWFLFWFLLILGHIPPVPIAEQKEEVLRSGPGREVQA
jgi:molybdopterin-containing oxidoreductase family membrane subunit